MFFLAVGRYISERQKGGTTIYEGKGKKGNDGRYQKNISSYTYADNDIEQS